MNMKCLNCENEIEQAGVPYCSRECFREHGLDETVEEEEEEEEPEDYDDYQQEEYYVDNVECNQCGEIYSYNDMSPDYVKAGYCSQNCAEVAGWFERQ